MTPDELEDIAMYMNAPIPQKMGLAESVLFWKLRYLHALHRVGGISREQAAHEKRRFLISFEAELSKENAHQKRIAHTAGMWKSMEQYQSQYRKDRSLENADLLVNAMDGQWIERQKTKEA